MDGVEYIEGTDGPRCVMPISGVVTIVCSSDAPGTNPSFTSAPFLPTAADTVPRGSAVRSQGFPLSGGGAGRA